MPQANFDRMIKLIENVFATRNDPGQIQVDPKQMKKLQEISRHTLSELANEDGPLIWILLIPTTEEIMHDFLDKRISEKELLENTKPHEDYSCIYLCSATTLPEYRGKGETKKLCIAAIQAIREEHPIKTLFVWPFTQQGEKLSETIAKECGLALLKLIA